eukprot:Platyproteum_vivax@DN7482_c0_g1_i2.p1
MQMHSNGMGHHVEKRPWAFASVMKGNDHFLGAIVDDPPIQFENNKILDNHINTEWTVGKAENGNHFLYENDQNIDTPETKLVKEVIEHWLLKKYKWQAEGQKVDNVPFSQVRRSGQLPDNASLLPVDKTEPAVTAGGVFEVKSKEFLDSKEKYENILKRTMDEPHEKPIYIQEKEEAMAALIQHN